MSAYTIRPGDVIQLDPSVIHEPAPGAILIFLEERGWQQARQIDRWAHPSKGYTQLTWEQAMACEFYEFISLGGK